MATRALATDLKYFCNLPLTGLCKAHPLPAPPSSLSSPPRLHSDPNRVLGACRPPTAPRRKSPSVRPQLPPQASLMAERDTVPPSLAFLPCPSPQKQPQQQEALGWNALKPCRPQLLP